MKKYIIGFIMTLNLSTFGQTKNLDNLANIKEIILTASHDKVKWNLYNKFSDKNYAPSNSEEVINDLNKWIIDNEKINKSQYQGQLQEYKLILQNKAQLKLLFYDMTLIGNNLGEFFYSSIPIRFAVRDDKSKVLVLTGINFDKVFNTLKFTSKQRAANIVSVVVLPALKSFTNNIRNDEIKNYAMVVFYGSKDFSKESNNNNLEDEVLSFVVSSNIAKRYVNGSITDDEIINAADIYLKDRDMVSGLKKIKVVIE